jgi:predicted nucleic acid-binding protein
LQWILRLPVAGLTVESMPLILTHHIYIADAIQTPNCNQEKWGFVNFDKKLIDVAKAWGLRVM